MISYIYCGCVDPETSHVRANILSSVMINKDVGNIDYDDVNKKLTIEFSIELNSSDKSILDGLIVYPNATAVVAKTEPNVGGDFAVKIEEIHFTAIVNSNLPKFYYFTLPYAATLQGGEFYATWMPEGETDYIKFGVPSGLPEPNDKYFFLTGTDISAENVQVEVGKKVRKDERYKFVDVTVSNLLPEECPIYIEYTNKGSADRNVDVVINMRIPSGV